MRLRARAESSVQRAKWRAWSGTRSRLLYSRVKKAWSGAFMPAASLPRFAPQAHRFLSGAVEEGEQHALVRRLQLERRPRRHDEGVARLELEFLAGDDRRALAFDHRVDGAVSAAVGAAAEALGEKLQERG